MGRAKTPYPAERDVVRRRREIVRDRQDRAGGRIGERGGAGRPLIVRAGRDPAEPVVREPGEMVGKGQRPVAAAHHDSGRHRSGDHVGATRSRDHSIGLDILN